MKTTNIMQCISNHLNPLALAGAVLCLATSAQAAPVTVLNGSFEETTGASRTVLGVPTIYYRGVDILDANDGVLDGDLFHTTTGNLMNQPTGNEGPRNWTTFETEADVVAYDARWPGWHNGRTTGPTDGLQALMFDKRGTTGARGDIKQTIGTVSTLGVGNVLVMTFDARLGEPGSGINSGQANEDTNVNFYSFFNVNGTRDTAGQFVSNMGTQAQGRKIKSWLGATEMNLAAGNLPAATAVSNTLPPSGNQTPPATTVVPSVDPLLGSQAGNMGQFTVVLPLSGLAPTDSIDIGFWWGKLAGVANVTGSGTRVYVDNVKVESVGLTTSTATTTDWHTTTTWDTGVVPLAYTPVLVNANAITISTGGAANCNSLKISGSGSVTVTGQSLTIASSAGGAFALDTAGGTLSLDATSTLNIPKANTSASLAGLTVATGTILNITNELTVDSAINLSGATLNTPKVTLAGGTLTKSEGLTIGSGKLISGNGTVVGTVTVAGGGKVSPGTDTSANTFSASGLTLDSGSLLTINAASVGNDQITVTTSGALTINGGVITLLNADGTAPASDSGTYNLIGYSGSIVGNVSNLSVLNKAPGKSYTFAATGSFVTLTIATAAVWDGGGSDAKWSTQLNWTNVSPVTGQILPFVSAGAGGAILDNDTIGGSYSSLQFQSGAPAFTLNGNAVTLTSDYLGNVVINNSTAIQTVNMPVTLTGAAKLNAASGEIVIGSASTITNAGFDLTVNGPNAVTLSGAISGTGGVIRSTDAGKLNINSATALGSGTLTINGGTIDNTSAGAVAVSTAPLQAWNANFTFTGTNNLNLGTGTVSLGATLRTTVNGSALTTLTVGGPIAGTGKVLDKNGSGTLVLAGAGSSLTRLGITGGKVVIGSGASVTLSSTLSGDSGGGYGNINGGSNLNDGILVISSGSLTTTAGADLAHDGQWGKVIVEGTGSITSNGEWLMGRNTGHGSLIVKDDGIVNGGGNTLRLGRDNIRDNYVGLFNNAQATFGAVEVFPSSHYGEGGFGSGSVLQIADNAKLTATSILVGTMPNSNNSNVQYAYAQVTQSGTSIVTVNGNVTIATRIPVAGDVLNGTYNLNGGELKVRQINNTGQVLRGTAKFNLHGGKLTYNDTVAQTNFIELTSGGTQGTGSLYLYETTVIDDNGQAVTINQAILSPNTGDGLASITVTAPFGSYFMTPEVYVSGGGGSGATAIPVLNDAGQVTAITVTNPGLGYTSKPSVQLWYNGGSSFTVDPANVTMATNAYAGGLTKQGLGTLTLTGANTYTGDTVVQAGTLSISQAYLADGADVKLYTVPGATLNLNTSAATDTIRSLYIDNVQKASGVWGAIGSGAPNTSALITGNGFLNVLIGASGYASWAATNGLSSQPSDDSNNDGVANGVAYFMDKTGLATNPGINSSGQVTWPNGGNIPSSAYGTQYVVQTSSDLQTWTDVPVGNLDANTDAVGLVDGSLSYTLTGASPRFVRLKVIPN